MGAPETEYRADGPDAVQGRVRLGERHQGWSGVAHGGIVALVVDEAVAYFLTHRAQRSVTARLEIDYVRPLPLGRWLSTSARLLTREGRKSTVTISVDAEGMPLATGLALVLDVPRGGWTR